MKRLLFACLIFSVLLSACASALGTATPTSTPIPPTETSMPPTDTPTPIHPTITPTPVPEFADAFEAVKALGRGVNLGNMLEAPNEGDWGLKVQEEYFDLIQQAGFDSVRIPVRWNAHAQEASPYTIDPAFFARVDEVLNWALARDLVVILDEHGYDEMAVNPRDHEERFLAIWKQLAEHYKDYPPTLFFELLNEPNSALTSSLWNEFMQKGLATVRESNPQRIVLVGGVSWNAYNQLQYVKIPAGETRIIGVFHYYEPFQFTHQGAEWVDGSTKWLGNTWGTDVEKAQVRANFLLVDSWVRDNKLPVVMNEFGAYSKAPLDSRIRWMEYVAREAEKHGFAWMYWEFGAGFGLYDPNARVWREDLLKALIP